MNRAIRLAMNGRGGVEPNPMVGCVIARGDRVIGEGYHAKYGSAHAEPIALANCNENPAGATVFVTLEPCCHTNKQTPPCVPRLLEARIGRVVVGCLDPNPAVAGRGIEQLRAGGVQIEVGILEAQCRQLNAAYFARVVNNCPYVTLKWAQSANGKIAGGGGRRQIISNPRSLGITHQLRARCDAIMIGINTALNDDPLLLARRVDAPRKAMRIVLDRDLRLPPTSRLAGTTEQGQVLVYCSAASLRARHAPALAARGVRIIPIDLGKDGNLSLPHVLNDLPWQNVTHLLVEPGPMLAKSFIEANLADRLWIVRSPRKIDDATAPSAVPIPYAAVAEAGLDGDRLSEHLNPNSPAFFHGDASADFVTLT